MKLFNVNELEALSTLGFCSYASYSLIYFRWRSAQQAPIPISKSAEIHLDL